MHGPMMEFVQQSKHYFLIDYYLASQAVVPCWHGQREQVHALHEPHMQPHPLIATVLWHLPASSLASWTVSVLLNPTEKDNDFLLCRRFLRCFCLSLTTWTDQICKKDQVPNVQETIEWGYTKLEHYSCIRPTRERSNLNGARKSAALFFSKTLPQSFVQLVQCLRRISHDRTTSRKKPVQFIRGCNVMKHSRAFRSPLDIFSDFFIPVGSGRKKWKERWLKVRKHYIGHETGYVVIDQRRQDDLENFSHDWRLLSRVLWVVRNASVTCSGSPDSYEGIGANKHSTIAIRTMVDGCSNFDCTTNCSNVWPGLILKMFRRWDN